MSNKRKLEQFPKFKNDKEAELFVEKADLSKYDFSSFKPMHFEFEKKEARINMRLPQRQLDILKAEAGRRGIPYQRLIRELLSHGMENLKSS